MKQITLLSGSGHPELAEGISKRLGIPLSRVNLKKFSNLETSVEIIESVRGMDVFIFQSFECKSLNHLLMEVLILVNACKIASAAHSKYLPVSARRPPSYVPL